METPLPSPPAVKSRLGQTPFWRPGVHLPHAVLDEHLPVWFYIASKSSAWTAFGRPHPHRRRWWKTQDLAVFGLHHPPCPLDDLERQAIPLGELSLGPRDAELPEALNSKVQESQRQAREEAATWRESETRYTPIAAARAAAPRSTVGHGEAARAAVRVWADFASTCFMITHFRGLLREKGLPQRRQAAGAEGGHAGYAASMSSRHSARRQ
ncbi:hypothetical protein [Streptomyces hiroshimensis]